MDGNQLIASLLVGTLGLALLMYGKKQSRLPHMVAGLCMMVLPYFMPNALLTGAIGLVFSVALFVAVRAGL